MRALVIVEASERPRVSQGRLTSALFFVGATWIFGNSAASGTLLAAKVALLAPDDKTFAFGLAMALSAAASTIALVGWGAISDVTRTRFGARTPWIVFGGVAGAAVLAALSFVQQLWLVVALCPVYALLQGALPAAVVAVFADRVPRHRRGTASAIYGTSQVIAGAGAGILASRYLLNPDPLILISGMIMAVGALGFVVLAPDEPNTEVPRATHGARALVRAVSPPKGAPDFYWAFANRFLMMLAVALVSTYMLYMVTDYIGIPADRAGGVVAQTGLASLVTLVLGTVLGGVVSDRVGRRKPILMTAATLMALGALIPLLWPTATGIVALSAVSGLGLGTFMGVDAALMTEVLPDADARAKDLGILNSTNNIPSIIAPGITAGILGLGLGYATVFALSIVVALLGLVCVIRIRSVR